MHKRALIPAMAVALLAMPAWAQTAPAPVAPDGPPAAAMPPPPPPGPPHGPRPGAEMDGPGEPDGGPMMRMGPHRPFGPPPPPPPSHLAGLAPAIHLRYGDLALDVQCSIRDDAEACTDAAVKLINQLRGTDSGDGGDDSGSSE